ARGCAGASCRRWRRGRRRTPRRRGGPDRTQGASSSFQCRARPGRPAPRDNPPMPARRLVLASTSRYRSELLQRLRLSFTVRAPGVDEDALPDEAPRAIALRLALAKADAVADLDRDA